MSAYGTRTLKRRRRTKAEIQTLDDAVAEVLREDHPQSVRHVFYRLVGHPYYLVPKDDSGYRAVQRRLLILREAGTVPWAWVSDGTRWRVVQPAFDTKAEAVRHAAETYRRDLWRRTPVYCEVWCESDSIAGTIVNETERYNVPLMTSRGFSSMSYLHAAAMAIQEQDRPAYLYYVGDWDPSGKIIPDKIEAAIRRFAPDCGVHFERLLVTPEQIRDWDLPTKPPKKTTHSVGFEGGTVEAEAILAATTRHLVREAIEQHLDLREVEVLEVAEESERVWLDRLADVLEEDGDG